MIRVLAATLLLAAHVGFPLSAAAASLYFTTSDADAVGRVEVRVGDPETPADIGAEDFTLEFWMRADVGNTTGAVACNTAGYTWIDGNIVFDRDRISGTRDFGLAIADGRIAFGVENANGSYTLCSESDVTDASWRHIAVQRRIADGMLWLYVDGVLEEQAQGPAGDISYPDGQGDDDLESLLVIGREKFDFGPPGFNGWLDEIRLSNVLRYQADRFDVPSQPFQLDAGTLALYHLDENSGDTVVDENGLSSGARRYDDTAGPEWSQETPFSSSGSAGQIRFTTSDLSVSEGTATLEVTVSRAGGSQGMASVEFSVTGGTATANADFEVDPVTLTWADGQSGSRTVSITMLDDSSVESEETIELGLSNASGAALGSPAIATVLLSDDDGTPPPPPPPSSGGGGNGGGGGTLALEFALGLSVFGWYRVRRKRATTHRSTSLIGYRRV